MNCTRLIIRYTFQSQFLQRSIYICRTYKFLTNYFSHCAVWILCVISLERAAVTKRYIWNQNVFSRKHSYCTLIVIYVVLFLLNLHYLIYFGSTKLEDEHRVNQTNAVQHYIVMCSSDLQRLSNERYEYFLTYYFSWMDFFVNSLIPFMIILIANTTVMYSVCKTHLLMKNLGVRQTRSPRDTQLAYILFVSTFLFLLLTFPLRVFSVIQPYLKYEKEYLILLDGIMRFLLYLDHGCGFYLYTFTGELFRRELKKFLSQCVYKIFRRRFCNWLSIESRRQSELSCSNGGLAGGSHIFHPLQPTNIQLKDSLSSRMDGGSTTGAVRTSIHSLHLHKTQPNACPSQFVHNRPPLILTLSASSPRPKMSPPTRKANSLTSGRKYGLVKRYSSSCFESEYQSSSIPCAAQNLLPTIDLDPQSDYI